MAIKLRDIKRAYQEAVASRAPSSRERCPAAEELYACLEPRASRRLIDKITEHLSECRLCLEEFRNLRLLSAEKRRTLEDIRRLIASGAVKTMAERKRSSGRKTYFLAAPVLAATLLALLLIISQPASIHDVRDRRERTASGTRVTLLNPAGGRECQRAGLRFEWAPLAEADYYLLELFDENLASLWQSPCLFEPSIIPPPEIVRGLRPGRKYFWTVTAKISDGGRMESAAAFFRLK